MKQFIAPHLNINEFTGSFIEAPTEFCTHALAQFEDGAYHLAQVLKSNPAAGSVHRAYPTWQPWKTVGAFGPSAGEVWVKYCFPPFKTGEWLSLATFSGIEQDADWNPITLNVLSDGTPYLFHAPVHGASEFTVLSNKKILPHTWVKIGFKIDFRDNGSVIIFVDEVPTLYAKATRETKKLTQAHFGMYCSGTFEQGWVANSNLLISENQIDRIIH